MPKLQHWNHSKASKEYQWCDYVISGVINCRITSLFVRRSYVLAFILNLALCNCIVSSISDSENPLRSSGSLTSSVSAKTKVQLQDPGYLGYCLNIYGNNNVWCFEDLISRALNACHAAGRCAGLLSWSHSCSGWRQRTQLFSQLCHSLRYHTYRYKLIFQMCCAFMCASVTVLVFMLGDDDGRFLMDRETGELKLTRGVRDRLTTPALRIQVMVRPTYSVLIAGLKDTNFSFLLPIPFSLLPLCLSTRHTRMMTPGSTLLLQCWSKSWQ